MKYYLNVSLLELLEKFESTEYARAFCEAVAVTTW